MGSCVSSKSYTKDTKSSSKKEEKEKKSIAKEKRIVIAKKIKNAPILKLEDNELYAKRKKPYLASRVKSELSTELCAELTKISTACFNDKVSPLCI
ncbi:unnamed protein product [Blepharisma stoltei]|uniref:Uncharacterized protein n=1 Tax=Blepharisma stoltei TaxID=1481888 RepID=A0AAU9JHL5_9CILI|nr:unnamed protein product [Blepharisma stoltei]